MSGLEVYGVVEGNAVEVSKVFVRAAAKASINPPVTVILVVRRFHREGS
jgi:hypothetical protein